MIEAQPADSQPMFLHQTGSLWHSDCPVSGSLSRGNKWKAISGETLGSDYR